MRIGLLSRLSSAEEGGMAFVVSMSDEFLMSLHGRGTICRAGSWQVQAVMFLCKGHSPKIAPILGTLILSVEWQGKAKYQDKYVYASSRGSKESSMPVIQRSQSA